MSGSLATLPGSFTDTRAALQRVAVHVLARRRQSLTGKFGLRATPGGFGTPAAGTEHEVLRVAGSTLVRERTGAAASTGTLDLRIASLADAATFGEVDLAAPLDVGHDTPPVGDAAAPLAVDQAAAAALADWYAFGWQVLDATLASLGPAAAPSVIQIWPEHFDAGCDVGVGGGRRTNLGASPGDGFHPEPYLYVGPWDAERPGEPAYWNAPFGAVLTHGDLRAATDPAATALDFFCRGLDHLTRG